MATQTHPMDDTPSPASVKNKLFQWLSVCGHTPEDSVELKRQKSLLTVVSFLKGAVCAGWYIPFFLFGATYAAFAPLGYQLLTILSIWVFSHTKDVKKFQSRQMVLILVLPLGVHTALGGFAASGCVILWAFLSPLIALLFRGPKESVRWFLAFLAVVTMGGILDTTGVLRVFPLPWWMVLMFYMMNIACVTGIVYAGVRYFGYLLEKEKEIQVELNHQLHQASEHKSKFLAGMSHELRTPLNAILGFTRIVKRRGKKVLPEKQLDNLDKVLTSASHLLELINDILDLSKIEAGHIEIEMETFSIRNLLQSCVSTSTPMVREGVTLLEHINLNQTTLHSDSGKVKQILLNLLSNAAKFTHKGEIRVSAFEEDNKLIISVSDTGIGISEEAKQRVFEEFQQADSSTTKQYGGTGLGLSISFRLAKLLNGSLSLESTPGEGSTFSLTLPLQPGDKAWVGEEQSPVISDPTPKSHEDNVVYPQAQPTLLAIDDDPDVIYLLRENLKDMGYQVVGASSGQEGIRKARSLQPFAITLDIKMPEQDGWQTLQELKEDETTKNIPVIMLSILDNKPMGKQLGATDSLMKPLDFHAIKQALEKISNPSEPISNEHVLVVSNTHEGHHQGLFSLSLKSKSAIKELNLKHSMQNRLVTSTQN